VNKRVQEIGEGSSLQEGGKETKENKQKEKRIWCSRVLGGRRLPTVKEWGGSDLPGGGGNLNWSVRRSAIGCEANTISVVLARGR